MGKRYSGRGSLFDLAYSGVFKGLISNADPLSWILLSLAAISLCAAFFSNYLYVDPVSAACVAGEFNCIYKKYFLVFWYAPWVFFVLSTIAPVVNLSREMQEPPLSILIGLGFLHLVSFIVISSSIFMHHGRPDAVAGLLAAFVGSIMIGIGWVVQHQSAARSTRRTHTFNILMQSRLSEEFQKNLKLRQSYYHSGVSVDPVDALLATPEGLVRRTIDLNNSRERELLNSSGGANKKINRHYDALIDDANLKHKSLKGVVYLLNFYEFMCAGINRRELDDVLLKLTVEDILKGLYRDTSGLRYHLKSRQPKVWCEMDIVLQGIWKD